MEAAYTGDARPELLELRYALIDQILEYRRTGRLTARFLELCEQEARLAPLGESRGVRRLAELASDGRPEARRRLDALLGGSDWRGRFEALHWAAAQADSRRGLEALVIRFLDDRSARVSAEAAWIAFRTDLFGLADQVEAAARLQKTPKARASLFSMAFHLRENRRTGRKGRDGLHTTPESRARFDKALAAFEASL